MSYKTLLIILLMASTPLNAAHAWGWGGGSKTTPSKSHQVIKAKVVDSSPNHFTINVKDLDNMDADENAPTFAVYTSAEPPKTCGDFSKLDLKYEKPDKYKRVFDLSDHKEVLAALKKYECVVVKNKA